MEERGCLIIRTLCKYMQTSVVFPLLASIITVFVTNAVNRVERAECAIRLALRPSAERHSSHRRRGF